MTLIEERFREAQLNKNNDITSYVWKGPKRIISPDCVEQDEVRLVDADEKTLNQFYEHCRMMLFNGSKTQPGRYSLLALLREQRDKCGVELMLRWLKDEKSISRYSFVDVIRTFMNNNREHFKNEEVTLGDVTTVPNEYMNLPINYVIDGCMERLGKFDRTHITLTFILRQGLWLTSQEIKDLHETDAEGKVIDKLDVIKKRLGIKTNLNLVVNSKGLTYTQLRAMLQLKSKKYSELTTDQLSTLRNRILFSLEDQTYFHIKQWEERMEQIEKVAEFKKFTLKSNA